MITLLSLFSHNKYPPLSETCLAFNIFLFSISDQKGINEQWDDPVTESSKIVACGVKKRDTKSTLTPGAVNITPPVPKFILSNLCLLIWISYIGVGIGGIAIAMASKESLENLLGSFTIFFDKPFLVGDLVSTGNITGTVEKVGFRSTRIRTFDKSVVTVPNKNMISAELDNLGKRKVRRARFYIGLTYDTSIDQMKKVVNEIETLINDHPRTDQEGRVKFQEFGASSLDIMVLFYVNSTKWDDFIDVKEDINFKIMRIVNDNNCEFAFPSTTVYLQK